MEIDKKTLKKLDQYNLRRLLELVSVGNFVRGFLLAQDSFKKIKSYFSELTEEGELEEEEIEETEEKEKKKPEKKMKSPQK